MPRVYNKSHGNVPSDAVYIGRPTVWGNPFAVGQSGTREEVIEKFRHYFLSDPSLVELAKTELRGRDLVCFCSPLACHGDVLIEVANMPLSYNG